MYLRRYRATNMMILSSPCFGLAMALPKSLVDLVPRRSTLLRLLSWVHSSHPPQADPRVHLKTVLVNIVCACLGSEADEWAQCVCQSSLRKNLTMPRVPASHPTSRRYSSSRFPPTLFPLVGLRQQRHRHVPRSTRSWTDDKHTPGCCPKLRCIARAKLDLPQPSNIFARLGLRF